MRFSYRPEISIIMPTFNRALHIETALQSILGQSFRSWELIIIDDGSTDNTFSILDRYISKFPNIRYMKQSNRKAALARNAGIQASFGRYVTFLDSDDHYLENHLETRITLIEEMQGISMLSGGFLCDETMMVKDCYHPDKLIGIRECILGGTMFGKRELFFALEGFNNLEYAEDTDLWNRASKLFDVKKIEDPKTYVYQRANDSTTLNY
jgi:glycosyltransferase involved in cell wall biosynthesis